MQGQPGDVGPDPVGRYRQFGTRLARASARLRADWTFTTIDAVTVAVSYTAALGLRGLDAPAALQNSGIEFVTLLPVIVLVHLLANFVLGVYGHEWEYASVEEAMRLIVASAVASTMMVVGLLATQAISGDGLRLIPIGVVVMGTALALGGMGAVRFRARMFSFRRTIGMVDSEPTLVVGTGRAAAELARTGIRGQQPIRVVGFVSRDAGQSRKRIAGLPVLGSLKDVATLVGECGIDQVLIAEPLDSTQIRDLVDVMVEVDVRLRIVPQLEDVLSEEDRLQDVRDLSVTDLLPRPVVNMDDGPVAELLAGRRVVVTGAGGSIGSEIVRQVLEFGPAAVVAVDHDETHLHDASFSWQEHSSQLTTVLCDIRDVGRLDQVFAASKPHVVFHAAAHKHVPILENCPGEAVKTNIAGTENVLNACHSHEVDHFVLISTDKAVEPTSVMGASKRVAEMLTQSADQRWGDQCTHTAVRFGNVLGSRGSVVPTFKNQIQAGGPVTVTDPNMLRYFMTVDEAVQLVLQVSALSDGGEVFVLDMGEPVRIGDLARRMIRLAGLVPGRDIEVRVTGVRPGEKHREILSKEPLEPTRLNKICVARPGHPGTVTLIEMVKSLSEMAGRGATVELREFILAVSNREWNSDEIVNLAALEGKTVFESG